MKRKRKIAILSNYPAWLHCHDLPVNKGHYGVWHVALHEAMADNDEFELHRIILDKNVKKQLDFKDKGQFFHVLPGARKKIGLYTSYIWDRWQVHQYLNKLRPDLVHGWGTEESYGLCTRDFMGKKLFSVQGLLKAYLERASLSSFLRKQSIYEPRVLRSIPTITTESAWAKDRVREIAPNARVLLWDYAVEERFFSIERRIHSMPYCVLAGTNSPVKNVPLAIRAFSRPELQHVKLYLAGVNKDSYTDLPKNIIPLGRVSREQMVELLRGSWCLVHPSLADSCPNIVKEARVLGISAVVTSDCGAKQYIISGKSGFVTKPNSEEELLRAVLHITRDQETADTMGRFDQKRCRKALSSETMVNEISAIYRDILGY